MLDNHSVKNIADSTNDKEKADERVNEMAPLTAASTFQQVNETSSAKRVNEMSSFKEYTSGGNAIGKESQCSKEFDVGSRNINTRDGSLALEAMDSSHRKPEVGMVFYAEDHAYRFYNLYAKRKGFSVRKGHRSRRKDGSTRVRVFLCSNEGTRRQHRTHITKKPRSIVRTNCLARIEYKVNRDNIWIVSKIIDEHNHPLISQNKIHMLRSHRKRLLVRRGVNNELYNMGVKPAQAYTSQAETDHGTENPASLLKNQSNNLHTKRMRDLEKGDAQFFLDILKAKQAEDPSFFYAVQLDDKERLTNLFWADALSIVDYAYFGDAVSLDTTYRTSMYDIPFAPLIGVNHHKQIVVFGAALLLDETVESFIWLFKTFMAAMSGRQPKTIFTDHCAELSEAISMTLPETCQRLCLWHILQNAPKHLSHVYNREPNFQKDFKNCIYECGSEEDFCNGWDKLISMYDLASNSWLEDLYAVRGKWALVHRQNSFCATMTTTKWSEIMDNHFKLHFYRKLPPSKFIMQYHKALFQLREKDLLEDCESRQTKPVLLVDVPMLHIAAESYTRILYKDFEDEYKSQLACLCEPVGSDGTIYTFRVSLPQKRCYGIVEFNTCEVAITCSCKKFESMGILCMHALKVLNNNNILYLPSQYILKRWTKEAKDGVIDEQRQSIVDSDGQEPLTLRYGRVWRKAVNVAVKSAVSNDALELVEHRLDKFMLEMEHVLRNAPPNKQIEDVNDVNIMQNTLSSDDICFDAFE